MRRHAPGPTPRKAISCEIAKAIDTLTIRIRGKTCSIPIVLEHIINSGIV